MAIICNKPIVDRCGVEHKYLYCTVSGSYSLQKSGKNQYTITFIVRCYSTENIYREGKYEPIKTERMSINVTMEQLLKTDTCFLLIYDHLRKLYLDCKDI